MYRHSARFSSLVSLATALCVTALAVTPHGAGAQPAATTPNTKKDYTAADVAFMQGMIGHHAQAVVMGKMAVSHGANANVANFCKKVIISQRDEIELMQTWLTDRGQHAPEAATMPMAGHDMAGMKMADHDMMPGMLTPAQMQQLDKATGKAWDRLFLTFMIQHHEGALVMVKTLFDSPAGGQGPEIFGYATGVDNDQRGEIERMQKMLVTLKEKHAK